MAENEEYHVYRNGLHSSGVGVHGVYQNKTRARNTVDKLNEAYGAHAHGYRVVPKEKTHEAAEMLGRGKPYGCKPGD